MGLWDNLLGAILKLTDPAPTFSASRCLLEKNTVGGCDLCQQTCPHQAINLENLTVEIDASRCTSCGLCTQVCPGAALEFPLGPVQEGLTRGKGQIRCSQVQGSGDEVRCLGQLTPGVLAEASSRVGSLTLAHGNCAACKIGGPEVLPRLQGVVSQGQNYFPPLDIRLHEGPLSGVSVGRREFFGAMLGGAKRSAAELIPNLPLPVLENLEADADLPAELQLRILAARRSPSTHWPKVTMDAEGCTLCPVCTNVCPTQAIERIHENIEGLSEEYAVRLNVSACTGCQACVNSCPPQVLHLATADKDEVLGEPLELFRGTPPWYDA